MSEFCLIGASVESFGHPTNCQEPAPGTVESDSSTGIKFSDDGSTAELATIDSATISIPDHAHDHNILEGCHEVQSHSIDPDTGNPDITVDGSPIYLVEDSATTDPTTGGPVDITSNPFNTDVTSQ